jgi:hypothetical protein
MSSCRSHLAAAHIRGRRDGRRRAHRVGGVAVGPGRSSAFRHVRPCELIHYESCSVSLPGGRYRAVVVSEEHLALDRPAEVGEVGEVGCHIDEEMSVGIMPANCSPRTTASRRTALVGNGTNTSCRSASASIMTPGEVIIPSVTASASRPWQDTGQQGRGL